MSTSVLSLKCYFKQTLTLLLVLFNSTVTGAQAGHIQSHKLNEHNVNETQVGAAQIEQYLPLLANQRVGVVVNQTSRAHDKHLVDLLLENGIQINAIFAPEHGFRGDHDAGARVKSGKDKQTGIDIISIYGRNKKPSDATMANLDVIVFDIQDVGVRFYTYISSMHYMMQAAAENKVKFLVLDRPNPNIQIVDGPLLEAEFRSFVGMHPIPLSHGMTVGELAKMILGESWLNINSKKNGYRYTLNLTVIPVKYYSRKSSYTLPIAPSPNLPNAQSIQLYPSLCLFEATPISIGRGTDFPFQVIGHDKVFLSVEQLSKQLEQTKPFDVTNIADIEFSPRPIQGASSNPKLKGKLAKGLDLRHTDITGFDLSLFIAWHNEFVQHDLVFFERSAFMDKLSGTDKLRKAISQGVPESEIRASWQADLANFKKQRAPYLMYK